MKHFITVLKNRLPSVFAIIFWLIVWEIISLLIGREIYLPSPIHTAKVLIELTADFTFWLSILMSVFRVILGFMISCFLGIIIGIICGLNRFFYELFNPLVVAVKSTPVMSIIIIALLWFESDNVAIFVCFLMCFPIIWTNVVQGIWQVDENLLQMAQVYKVKELLVIRYIYMPSLMPYLAAGITTALGLGWKVTVASEVLSSPKYSIGGHLYNAKVYLQSPQLFAWTGVVILLSFGFEHVFKYAVENINKNQLLKDV